MVRRPMYAGRAVAVQPKMQTFSGAGDTPRIAERRDSMRFEVIAARREAGSREWFQAGDSDGGRCRIRTYDFHRVKVTLYR